MLKVFRYYPAFLIILAGYLCSVITYKYQIIGVLGYITLGTGILYLGMRILCDFIELVVSIPKTEKNKKNVIMLLYLALFIICALIVINKNTIIDQVVAWLSLIP